MVTYYMRHFPVLPVTCGRCGETCWMDDCLRIESSDDSSVLVAYLCSDCAEEVFDTEDWPVSGRS